MNLKRKIRIYLMIRFFFTLQNVVENEKECEVALLKSSKCHIDDDNHLKNNLPLHKDSVDVSGISSLMDITNLSENIPSSFSIDVQQLFPDATTEDIQVLI